MSSSTFDSPLTYFDNTTTTKSSSYPTYVSVISLRSDYSYPHATDIEFYMYKVTVKPNIEVDVPAALRTKKLSLTRIMTENSAVFDSSYHVYQNYVLPTAATNHTYSFPLGGWTASGTCSIDHIEIVRQTSSTSGVYAASSFTTSYGTYTTDCGGSFCTDIELKSDEPVDNIVFYIAICHEYEVYPTASYESSYFWYNCDLSS